MVKRRHSLKAEALEVQLDAAVPAASDYARVGAQRFERELREFLTIPSISALSSAGNALRQCAEFVARALKRAGLQQVEVHGTSGHPIVTGEYRVAAELPTVLLYGHYDVQPPEPMAAWDSPPFKPTLRAGRLYARGASDDKGQLYLHIKALEAMLQTAGTLPVNVKVLIEGEEEVGSPSLLPFMRRRRAALSSDIVLISDTEMAGENTPALTTALRGLSYLEMNVRSAKRDLHSGMYGGAALNAAEILLAAVAKLMPKPGGRICVTGLYRDVKPLTARVKAELRALARSEQAFKRELGVRDFCYEGRADGKNRFFIATTAEPSLSVSGVSAGYTGEGAKTIIPSSANVKLGVRLVANQDPVHVTACLKAQLKHNLAELLPRGLRSIELEFKEFVGAHPVVVAARSPAMFAAQEALALVYGKTPLFIRGGGSIPIVADFVKLLGVTPILMGFGLKKDAIHAPNESFALKDFHRGIASSLHFFHALSRRHVQRRQR